MLTCVLVAIIVLHTVAVGGKLRLLCGTMSPFRQHAHLSSFLSYVHINENLYASKIMSPIL